MCKSWSEEEITFLKNNLDKTCKEIGRFLNRTEKSVQSKLTVLGLKKHRPIFSGMTFGYLIVRRKVDRIDSNIGYVFSNCVPCCFVCNTMKTDLAESVFIEQARKIATHQENKNKTKITVLF